MMKKILLVVAVLAVLLILALVGGIFWFSSQLNSDSTRELVRQKVSEAVGADIQITGHHVSLLGSLHVEGVAVSNAAPDQASPLLAVKSFDAKVSLLSALKGKPTVNLVEIKDVDVNAFQTAEGGLSLPFKPKPKDESPESKAAEAETADQLKALNASVETIKVSNVNVRVFDPEKKVLASLKGLNVDGSAEVAAGVPSANMNVELATLELTPGLKVTDVKTPLMYQGGQAVLQKISGKLAGGEVSGMTTAQLLDPARAFTAVLAIKDSAMGDLIKDIGSNPETLTGALQLNFTGQGTLNAPKDLTGKGTLEIKDPVVGKLKSSPLPTGLVGLPALQTGKFDSIKGTYHIEGQKILVDDLQILSKGLNIAVVGDVGFDKNVNLNGRIKIDANPVGKVADVAQGLMQGIFGGKKKDDAASTESTTSASEAMKSGVPFTITGKAEKPVFALQGADPLNLISMVAKTLGFEVAPSGSSAPAAPEAAPAPAAATPAATEKPAESTSPLKNLLPF